MAYYKELGSIIPIHCKFPGFWSLPFKKKTEQRGIFAVEKLADLPPPCLLGAGEGNPELPPSSNALILR